MCALPSPHDWVDYLQAFLTPTVAGVAALIAYLQWHTNALRLKHERFERRFGMFEATRKFLADLIKRGDLNEEARRDFLSATSGARFVFGEKIANHLDVIHSKACDLERVQIERRDCDEADVGRLANERRDIMQSLLDALSELEKTFAKHI